MESNTSACFDWEKDFYVQDPSTFTAYEDTRSADSFEDSMDDNKENICPSNGQRTYSSRQFAAREPRVPLGDITHLFKKPTEDFDKLTFGDSDRKVKRMVRAMR